MRGLFCYRWQNTRSLFDLIPVSAQNYPWKTRVLAALMSGLMRFIHATSRKRYTNLAVLKAQFDSGKPCIIVAWHNRNILGPFGYLAHRPPGRVFSPLASASRDGSLAAAAMDNLGVECIRGSSSRGGAQALREMLRAAKRGHDLGITPDGPRGPKYKVQAGVIAAARLTGAPIIPMTYQARRRKELSSWDAMIVPYPFGQLHYVYGDPIQVPRDADEAECERLRLQVEQALMRIGELAEQFD
ncbi:MAG: DUF374 domain-containing protein [Oceanococcus sp.]|nr:MAG: DUF374 domain-containing protein [Oceanococcus sp.]